MTDSAETISSHTSESRRLEQRYGPGSKPTRRHHLAPNSAETGAAMLWSWKGVAYVFVLGFACLLLAPLTDLWWIVPLLGAATPVVLMVVSRRRRGHEDIAQRQEELLAAIAAHGPLTPLAAARETSCTAAEAADLMDRLADEGALTRLPAGRPAPVLPAAVVPPTVLTRGRAAPTASAPTPEPMGVAPYVPEEPLSVRELEVLARLAAGRTTAETAQDLFISVGTVKSHTGNIYRKLGAKNRTEAIARARQAGLIS